MSLNFELFNISRVSRVLSATFNSGRLLLVFLCVILSQPAYAGWKLQNPDPTAENLFSIWGSSEDRVFAVGLYGTIIHWDGKNWELMDSPTNEILVGVWGTDSGPDVYVVGYEGTLLHWNGQEWRGVDIPFDKNLYGVWGSGPDNVLSVGMDGRILKRSDAGWQAINAMTYGSVKALSGSSTRNEL